MKRPVALLVNPWVHDFAAYDLWARPMGLLVLGTVLRQQGWEPVLLDCLDSDHPGMPPHRVGKFSEGRFARTTIATPPALTGVPRRFSRYGVFRELVEKDLSSMERPVVILVTGMMTYWYTGLRETVDLLRKAFPGVPILLGGVYASLMPTHARGHIPVDTVIEGPGEGSLSSALMRHTGVAPGGPSGSCSLEFSPALDLMRKVRFLPLLTSRGCPFRCTYCASSRLADRFVRRPLADVADEIESAHARYAIKDIALYDDAFLADAHDHAVPLLEEIVRRLPGLRWHSPNGLHASAIDGRVASAMRRAGFETIRLGLESSSDAFHATTGRKTNAAQFAAAVEELFDAGFSGRQIAAYLLVGFPGQTRAQIEDGVDFCLGLGVTPKLAEYSPIPGTALWPEACNASRYPIREDPLFHNCTLMPAADPEVDWDFVQRTRTRIREFMARDARIYTGSRK